MVWIPTGSHFGRLRKADDDLRFTTSKPIFPVKDYVDVKVLEMLGLEYGFSSMRIFLFLKVPPTNTTYDTSK